MNIKPVKTKKDHLAALNRIEELWGANPRTKEGNELDVLAVLVAAYEESHFPIDKPNSIEVIKFRMEQLNMEDVDLVPYIGARSKVREILNGQCMLSLTMIRRLSKGLKIPVENLIKEYSLSAK